ncbi:hypothetical protein G6F56_003554 [Rhizopus delemar]|nr:hypothetical protein G6F56_003554 [Rhizopus delemar]
MADEADLREENLRSEMEEVKQELAASKKAEHAMESKYKKLMSKYESICEEDQSIDSAKVFKPKSFIGERTPENNKHLIQLIKELVSANNKLKIDLLEQSTEHEQELDGSTVCDTTEPVIHHHYHYRQEETTSPAYQLYHNICLVMERLQQTDTRALNRKLRRAFDIFDLSSMSNSLIENILASEVESLPKNMLSSNEDFSLLAQVVQDMLKEIAILRITINDIQVEYVKKVEESDLRLEKEIQREPTVLDWLSNVFHNGPHQKIIQRRSSLPSTITSSRMSKDHSSRIVRYSGPSSSYPTRTSCYKRRLAVTHPLRASQTPTVQKYSCIRKRRSLLVINSSETTGWLGNKINK